MLKSLNKYLSRILPYLIISITIFLTLGLFRGGINQDTEYLNCGVLKVIDGDTIKLDTGKYVRLIGIDTPEYHDSDKLSRDSKRLNISEKEIKKKGYQAYKFTQKLLAGKQVKLEFDRERLDKYNRLLAYVYLADGTFVNASIVESGYATVFAIAPNIKYYKHFLRLQEDARESKRGLWAEE